MIAWLSALSAGPMLLAGFALYLCRGARRIRRLTDAQVTELRVLAEIERHDDMI